MPINITMDYFKEVQLTNWQQIQEYCIAKWDGTFSSAKVFKGQDLLDIATLLCPDFTYKVKTAIMFINQGNFKQDMHIDGFTVERKGASNTALNIPILNCNQGPMFWYDGKYQLSNHDMNGLGYLKLNWSDGPNLVATKIIDSPTIVRINVPHHIENNSSNPRLMLTVRFVEDIPLDNNL
jgi:hypothetical protein